MKLEELFELTRAKFPELSRKADFEHVEIWGVLEIESEHSWFGSLANILNFEMNKDAGTESLKPLFEFIGGNYDKGNEEVKNCIDASFTENLFWEVPSDKAEKYWEILPENLKKLYLDFHFKKPF